MKYLILLSTLFIVFSCGKNDKGPRVVDVRGDSDSYRGYDIYAAAVKCVIPEEGRLCSQETSPSIMANQNFADICENKGFNAYDCGCKKRYLCSTKMDVLVSGYDYRGTLSKDISHDEIISCSDSGVFDPEGSDKLQENFRQRCEVAGYKAILVGCNFKRYLCPQKI